MPKNRIKTLLQLLAQGTATAADMNELYSYYRGADHESDIKDLIDEYWDQESFNAFLTQQQSEALYSAIQKRVSKKSGSLIKMLKPWMAAASITIAIFLTWYLINHYKTQPNQLVAYDEISDVAPPSTTNAVLLLKNGDKKSLSHISNIKADMMALEGEAGQNTIFNPRGSKQVSITLPDSSIVWLNAESSITYPNRFAEGERRVRINGEAYFEVVHRDHQPFIVAGRKTEVRVLGTHFNVNTFNKNTRVSLLEGSVQVSNSGISEFLKPGQAADVAENIKVVKIDTENTIAWKSDLFSFDQTPLKDIMNEIARWYDVEIDYKGEMPAVTLSGSISRLTNASKVLEMLKLSSGLDFKIEGRKIIVED